MRLTVPCKKHDLMKHGKVAEVLFPITIDDYIFEEWEHYLKPKVMAKMGPTSGAGKTPRNMMWQWIGLLQPFGAGAKIVI